MKKLCASIIVAAILATGAFAQNISSKASFTINTVGACANQGTVSSTTFECGSPSAGTTNWVTVGSPISVKTSNPTDLFLGVSLVTGLYTKTQVKGNSTGALSQSVAQGTVEVRVLFDDSPTNLVFQPQGLDGSGAIKGITFDSRIQTLNANLGNIFTDCFANAINNNTLSPNCTLTKEQITLILETAGAHSFHFVAANVGQGVHTIKVQARATATSSTTETADSAVAAAMFGLGSVTVESVKLLDPTTGAYF